MPLDLRTLFQQALKVSVAGSPLILGCGAPGVDTRDFKAIDCVPAGGAAISDLKPANPVDYMELRRIFALGGMDTNETFVSSAGTKCRNATDANACMSALTALKSMSGFGEKCLQTCSSFYLATQSADVVGSVTTLQALKAFLGTIDTEQEAVLIASAHALDLTCGNKQRGAVRKVGSGFEVVGTTGFACGEGSALVQRVLAVNGDGSSSEISSAILERGQAGCAIGRRPHGLCDAYARRARDPLARHFVAAAHLEAASVPAFLRLRDELRLHGAPLGLVLRAQVSAADEVRHTRAVAALARRFGGQPVAPRVRALPLRPFTEVVHDNAVEGCVRETFGALVAQRQAAQAKDPEIRRELRSIAEDETRHAELSWDVHAWAQKRLSRGARTELRRAQQQAVAALRQESAAHVDARLVDEAGMPPADEAVALLDELSQTLWT